MTLKDNRPRLKQKKVHTYSKDTGERQVETITSIKSPILKKVIKAAELPLDFMTGKPHIELCGNEELFIEAKCSLAAYDETCILIQCRSKMNINIMGHDLILVCMSDEELRIKGKIEKIEFNEGRAR